MHIWAKWKLNLGFIWFVTIKKQMWTRPKTLEVLNMELLYDPELSF